MAGLESPQGVLWGSSDYSVQGSQTEIGFWDSIVNQGKVENQGMDS